MVLTLVVFAVCGLPLLAMRFGADSRPRMRSRGEELAALGVTWEMHSSGCDTLAEHAHPDGPAWPQLPLYPCASQPRTVLPPVVPR